MPYRMAAAEISAAIFVGTSGIRFRENPVKQKYAAGQAAEFDFAGAGSRGSIPLAAGHRDGMPCERGRVSRLPCRFEGRQPSSG